MNINEKAAYLKGVFDGSDLDKSAKEVKIIGEMLDLMSKMATRISELEAECAELREYAEELDEDLGAVEEDLYFTDDDEDEDDEEYYGEEDDEYYELKCPNCGEIVCFDDSIEPDDLVCPACGEKVGDVEICDGDCDTCDNKECE